MAAKDNDKAVRALQDASQTAFNFNNKLISKMY